MAKNNNLPSHQNVQAQNSVLIPPLNPVAIDQLIKNQTKELELRAQELGLQKQQDDHGFEFGKKALEAQLEDRKRQREHNRLLQRGQYVLVSFLVLVVSGIFIVALWLNKDAIAIELLKAIGYVVAGGFGGFGIGRHKSKSQSAESNSQTSP